MKIRQPRPTAERHGHKRIWNDARTDKSSSSELSEAINSMYQFSLAEVRYVYPEDVPGDRIAVGDYFTFRNSRWRRRGRTLQELITLPSLIFLSRDWGVLETMQTSYRR